MAITLYSTNCPMCKVLEKKLEVADIEYIKNTDVDEMLDKGMLSAPYLEVNGELMNFNEAIKWVREA